MTRTEREERSVRRPLVFMAGLVLLIVISQIFPILGSERANDLERLDKGFQNLSCVCAQDLADIRQRRQDPRTTRFQRFHALTNERDKIRGQLDFGWVSTTLLHVRYMFRDSRYMDLASADWTCSLRPTAGELRAQVKACETQQHATR